MSSISVAGMASFSALAHTLHIISHHLYSFSIELNKLRGCREAIRGGEKDMGQHLDTSDLEEMGEEGSKSLAVARRGFARQNKSCLPFLITLISFSFGIFIIALGKALKGGIPRREIGGAVASSMTWEQHEANSLINLRLSKERCILAIPIQNKHQDNTLVFTIVIFPSLS